MLFWLGPASRFGPLLFTRFINGSHLLRMRNLPGLHAALRLAASSLTVAGDDVFRRDGVPGASHPTVTSRARPGRQLPVVRQVTARQAARDKTETDLAIHHIADLRPADGDTCRTGCYNVFEAARLAGVKRVIFASSNHAVGFHRRDRMKGAQAPRRIPSIHHNGYRVAASNWSSMPTSTDVCRLPAHRVLPS
jgi:nucleoside-diphosphate-sugar epimerase